MPWSDIAALAEKRSVRLKHNPVKKLTYRLDGRRGDIADLKKDFAQLTEKWPKTLQTRKVSFNPCH